MENIFPGWEVSGKDPLLLFALSIQKDMYIYSSDIDYIHEIGMP